MEMAYLVIRPCHWFPWLLSSRVCSSSSRRRTPGDKLLTGLRVLVATGVGVVHLHIGIGTVLE